jgi:UPF0716 protein FxsA
VGKLFLLFAALPLVDLWLLLRIGDALGFWSAVALVVATGALGAWLARAEGARVLEGWRRALSEGRLPEEGVLSGALVLAGGLLLVTPGVVTDVLGLALLFPPSRRIVAAALRRWLSRRIAEGRIRVVGPGGGFRPAAPPDEPIDVTPPRRGERLPDQERRPPAPHR